MNEITLSTNNTEIVIAPTISDYARAADAFVKTSVFSRELSKSLTILALPIKLP